MKKKQQNHIVIMKIIHLFCDLHISVCFILHRKRKKKKIKEEEKQQQRRTYR